MLVTCCVIDILIKDKRTGKIRAAEVKREGVRGSGTYVAKNKAIHSAPWCAVDCQKRTQAAASQGYSPTYGGTI